jgi:hypothetical protein
MDAGDEIEMIRRQHFLEVEGREAKDRRLAHDLK